MSGLEFEGLTAANFDKFKEHIIRSEEAYPEPMRSSAEDYLSILKEGKMVALIALLDGVYIGNVFASVPEGEDLEICRASITPDKKTLYVYNFLIDEAYRHKGYARMMLAELMEKAKGAGFEIVVGHFRHNGSLHLFKKFGGVEKAVFANWENSGEEHVLCELDLAHILPVQPAQPETVMPVTPPLPSQELPALEPSPQIEPAEPHMEPHDVMPFDMGHDSGHELQGMPSV
jgi:GNAT superfamily N-acetyltransferase